MAFMPLFIVFITLLRRSFEQMYKRMRVRVCVVFALYWLVMTFRFVVYCFIQFSTTQWAHELRGEIPLYISEIFIALCYTSIMFRLYRKQKRSELPTGDDDGDDLEDPLFATLGRNLPVLPDHAFAQE